MKSSAAGTCESSQSGLPSINEPTQRSEKDEMTDNSTDGPATAIASWRSREEQYEIEARNRRREALGTLRAAGVTTASISYDGESDDGAIDEIVFTPEIEPSSRAALEQAASTYAYSALQTYVDGWDNNEGSYGVVRIDVANDQSVLDHVRRYYEEIWLTIELPENVIAILEAHDLEVFDFSAYGCATVNVDSQQGLPAEVKGELIEALTEAAAAFDYYDRDETMVVAASTSEGEAVVTFYVPDEYSESYSL
jgi:hypothetical protein